MDIVGVILWILSSKAFWIGFAVNYLIGILYVLYFYKKTKKLREMSEEMKKKYYAFCNETETWNLGLFLLFSFLMVPRAICFVFVASSYGFLVYLMTIGKPLPIVGWRKRIVNFMGRVTGRLSLICGSYLWVSYVDDEIDYSRWLGKNYLQEKPSIRPPIVISNHRAWCDIFLNMTLGEFPSFCSSTHILKIPVVGYVAKNIGSFFVERSEGSSRDQTLAVIRQRIKEIKENSELSPISVFPEGGTSNGKFLLRFRRGAFETLDPIQPFYFEYWSPFVNPACDAFSMPIHFLFMACQPFSYLKVHRMPVVFPTKFMISNAEKKESWEIYAETIRDIYSETFHKPKSNISHTLKLEMKNFIYDQQKDKLE